MNQKNKKQIEVDMIVDSRELSQTEKDMLSEFISKDKLKNKVSVSTLTNKRHQHA